MNFNYSGGGLYALFFILGFITNFAAGYNSLIFANRVLIFAVFLTGAVSAALEIHPWILYGMVAGIVCSQSFIERK